MNERSNILVGYDLDNEFSQISYYNRKEMMPVTVSCIAGTAQYQFPTAICKTQGSDQWYYGVEANYFAEQKEGILVTGLLDICEQDQSVMVDGREYEPWELLAVFLNKSLILVNPSQRPGAITGIMLTVKAITRGLIKAVEKASKYIQALDGSIFIQDYQESFYNYVLNQKKDLWNYDVALFEYIGDQIYTSILHIDRGLVPVVVTMEEKQNLTLDESVRKDLTDELWESKKDKLFLEQINQIFDKKAISSAFLIGESFEQGWMDKSLTLLCHRRRVFQGDNLYTKGACYAIRDRIEDNYLKDYLFESSHMVRMNIGMEMIKRDKRTYYPLIQAGVNWFEAQHTCEFLLDGVEEIVLLLNAIDRHETRRYVAKLPQLPKRPRKTTRIRLQAMCTAKDKCRLQIEDLGFGEFFPSTGKVREEIIEF